MTAPGRKPLLGLAALVPILGLAAAAAFTPLGGTDESLPVVREVSAAQSGPRVLSCHGPLRIPEELVGGGDAALASAAPSSTAAVQTLAVEATSSLLFGQVIRSETLQEEDGSIRAPRITATALTGQELQSDALSQDVGASVQSLGQIDAPIVLDLSSTDAARPLGDAVQSTTTLTGDYRSLALSRCASPVVSASFLGASTRTGDSSVLVLRNTTSRPATASVQIWTAEGPAEMGGRSRVVVPALSEERVLLESIVPGQAVLGVSADALGAPLAMEIQTTSRDGLTPAGAEILTPLAPAASTSWIPGVRIGEGGTGEVVLMNPTGQDAQVQLTLRGADGSSVPLAADPAESEGTLVPAGAVVSVPIGSAQAPIAGDYAVGVVSDARVSAVVRSSVVDAAPAVDPAAGTPPADPAAPPAAPAGSGARDFAIAQAAPALPSGSVLALPQTGPAGGLSLVAETEAAVTIIPIGADGGAGEPLQRDLAAQTPVLIPAEELTGTSGAPAGLVISTDRVGSVHGAWVQTQTSADQGALLSSVIVPVSGPETASMDVQLD